MADTPIVLARGPWSPDQVEARWSDRAWEAPAALEGQADAAIAALTARGSPAHDGFGARLESWRASSDGLSLDLQPVRWALRLVEQADPQSLTAMCVVRAADGRWLAGRRAAWVATWAGRWALGAGGAVEVGEDPAVTLTRELHEEWRLTPTTLSIEALVALPSGLVALIGLATVAPDAVPVADSEHDEFAWWPADVGGWPTDSDERLKAMARFLSGVR